MKHLLMLVLALAFSSSAMASSDRDLKQAIASDLNGLLQETLQPGTVSVAVQSRVNEPKMTCETAPSRRGAGWGIARCDVEFSIRASAQRTCAASCYLVYVYEVANPSNVSRTSENRVEECLESLVYADCP